MRSLQCSSQRLLPMRFQHTHENHKKFTVLSNQDVRLAVPAIMEKIHNSLYVILQDAVVFSSTC
jgi:hypothetical protein